MLSVSNTYHIIDEDLNDRLKQRVATSVDGSLTGLGGYVQRNGFTPQGAVDYLASSVRNRFIDPQMMAKTIPTLMNKSFEGSDRAYAEHEAKMLQREQQMERQRAQKAQSELHKAANEARQATRAEDELSKELSSMPNESYYPVDEDFKSSLQTAGIAAKELGGGLFDSLVGTPAARAEYRVGSNSTGKNIIKYLGRDSDGRLHKMNMAIDTRNDAQRRMDALTNIGKSYAGAYAQKLIDKGLNAGADAIGYYATKAKLAYNDMRERKAMAKAETQRLKAEKQALANKNREIQNFKKNMEV